VTENRTRRRILYAAAISGVVHATVIAVGDADVGQTPEDLPPLAVRIVEIAPAVTPRPGPVPPQPRVAKSVNVARAPGMMPARPLPTQPSQTEPEPEELAVADEPATAEPGVAPRPEPVVVATAPSSTLATDAPALPAFPKSGRITYSLVYGRDRFPVGRTIQSWKIEGTRYQLASRSETTGVADLIRSQHRTYLSRGELTSEGLRPETFLMSRNRGRGAEEARATFRWAEGTVTLGGAANQHDEPLPRGSQDLVSFMYQLAIDPPGPGPKQATVTNGSRIETYALQVFPEEKIETPLGVLRVLPISQGRTPGRETVDVWLAVEYRYLPVRIRFFGRDGEPTGEQIVTEIRLSDD